MQQASLLGMMNEQVMIAELTDCSSPQRLAQLVRSQHGAAFVLAAELGRVWATVLVLLKDINAIS